MASVQAVLISPTLEVAVEKEPWSLSLRGAVELDLGGPPGFVTRLGEGRFGRGPLLPPDGDPPPEAWHRVIRLRGETKGAMTYAAVFDTDCPSAPTARIEIELRDEGTVSVDATVPGAAVCGQCFVASPGERFFGFGERSNAVGILQGVVENYVGEGPFQPHEYPFLTEVVPPWGIRKRDDATYFPIPWVLSTRGYGILVERDEVSYGRFRTEADDRWSVEVESDRLSYTVFAGPTPLDALARFTAAVGRQPEPERWWFGPWFQSGHANHVPLTEETRQVELLQDSGAAASAMETHCRYLPLGEDRGYEESEVARTQFCHSRGLAVLSYINPLIGEEYSEVFRPADATGALIRNDSGTSYVFRAYAGGREPPHTSESQFDFTHPAAATIWQSVAERMVEAGYDGWMEDFGEYTPIDATTSDGSTGTAAHNRYPASFHTAAAGVARHLEERYGRRIARFVRSGWTGTAAVAPIVWGGDPTTSWGFDGLGSALIEGLSMGASGVAMWGSDTGGFMSSLDRLTPELLVRWIQFSAFCPVMRTKASGIEIPPYDRPQIWDEEVLPSWHRWSRWHTRLNDYLMAAHAEYRTTGRPIMCALGLVYPDMGPIEDQYLLGPDLLVAPVLRPGATTRKLVIPPGRWFDLFAADRCFDGPDETELGVGPDDIPVLVRSGAVIGLLPDDVTSLSPYAPPLPDSRELLAFPERGVEASGALGPDRSYATTWLGGEWTLNLAAPFSTSWELVVRVPDRPRAGDVRGVEGWSWEAGSLTCALGGPAPTVTLRLFG